MYKSLYEFYRSNEWEQLIKLIRMERIDEQGITRCDYCHQPIIKARDAIGHHSVPLTLQNVNDIDISLNKDKIMLVHHRCHNEIHNRFGLYKAKKVYIVHGAPLSGKSSYVKDNKSSKDIVMDIDYIYQALTMQPLHQRDSNALNINMFGIRDAILDQIATRLGQWESAWIIGMYPAKAERERLAQRMGAELIHIESTQDECMERLMLCSDRDSNEWSKYIENYFIRYQD